MDAVHMVFLGPVANRIQHMGRRLPAVKKQFHHQLQPCFVQSLNHILKFLYGLLHGAAAVGAFGCKGITAAVPPVIQPAVRLFRPKGAVPTLRHDDLLKFHRRHDLQGGDSQLLKIWDLVHNTCKGSPLCLLHS